MSTPRRWSRGSGRQVDEVGWSQKGMEMGGGGTDKDKKGKKGGHTMTPPFSKWDILRVHHWESLKVKTVWEYSRCWTRPMPRERCFFFCLLSRIFEFRYFCQFYGSFPCWQRIEILHLCKSGSVRNCSLTPNSMWGNTKFHLVGPTTCQSICMFGDDIEH